MNTYLVTLADRSTGKDQRILVQSADSNNMQEFVESDAVRPTLSVNDPVVIAVHRLRVNRPHRTVFLALEKTNG
jgi:hypothetical protein